MFLLSVLKLWGILILVFIFITVASSISFDLFLISFFFIFRLYRSRICTIRISCVSHFDRNLDPPHGQRHYPKSLLFIFFQILLLTKKFSSISGHSKPNKREYKRAFLSRSRLTKNKEQHWIQQLRKQANWSRYLRYVLI